jgi:predicted dehydrogenase
MKLGTVGTSVITTSFIEAVHISGQLTLTSVFSRSIEKAKQFANLYKATNVFESLEEMAKSEEIDIVYIASPNSLHYNHAKLFLEHGKHVICEKPIFSNTKELETAFQVAKENGVFLFEAIRNIHSPNFRVLKESIQKVGTIRSALLHYNKYSSRYDAFLKGETPNIFSADFSGGALVDLGVYPLNAAVALFGKPNKIHYHTVRLRSGVDGSGTLVLEYIDFICTILCSKVSNSYISSEIQGEQGTVVLESGNTMTSIKFIERHSCVEAELAGPQEKNDMVYEIDNIFHIIKTNNVEEYEALKQLSHDVLLITEEARKQNKIVFGVEQNFD